jgi:hypothetical protein
MKTMIQTILFSSLLFALSTSANIQLQPGVSGAWIAGASGQGIFVNIARVNDQPNFVVTWYAYQNGEQIWLVGAQPFEYGIETLNIPMTITTGTGWDTDFIESDVVRTQWGTVTIDFTDCSTGTMQYSSNDTSYGNGSVELTRLTTTDGLSCHENTGTTDSVEKQSLAFMREEEKLARDVYLKFNRDYGENVFSNIADSEQTHMDSVLSLMYVYNVEDTSTGVEGTFNNLDLQALYDVLIDMGSTSLEDAYLAAALIEETDIRDIEVFAEDIEAQDILDTYDNLLCGSRNHLRSYVSKYEQLTANTYQVQIPELASEVAEILTSNNEQCGRR